MIKASSFSGMADHLDDRYMVVAERVSCMFGDFAAVDDVSLNVRSGQIHALLGTNGAGKTTLLESIQGLRRPTRGRLTVFNHDPWTNRTVIAGRTGTMLQESGLVDEMTVAGQLAFWQGVSIRKDSVNRVLEVVGLTHRRRTPVSVLSGGERRRLDFAMAIWGTPELIVLDEPTTGLDPQSRRAMWSVIQELNEEGATVLLTTHYLDEAQSLAESVTILDQGKIAVEGPMEKVLSSIPAQISFLVPPQMQIVHDLEVIIDGVVQIRDMEIGFDGIGSSEKILVTVRTKRLQEDVTIIMDWARTHNMKLDQLRCAPASLEEVFFDMASIKAYSDDPRRSVQL